MDNESFVSVTINGTEFDPVPGTCPIKECQKPINVQRALREGCPYCGAYGRDFFTTPPDKSGANTLEKRYNSEVPN